MAKIQFERQDLKGAARTLEPLLDKPSDGTLKLAAALYGAQGNLVGARRCVERIQSTSLQLEAFLELPTFHALHSDIDGARRLLKAVLPGGGGHPTPESIALPGVVLIQLASGDIEGARSTATMFASDLDAEDLVMQLLLDLNEVARAVELLSQRTNPPSSVTHAVAMAQLRAGDAAPAMKLVKEESDPHRRDLLRWSIAKQLAKTGDASGATRTAASIVDTRIRRDALWDIAVVEATAGETTALFIAVTAADPRNRLSMLLGSVSRMLDDDRERPSISPLAIALLKCRSRGC